MGHTYPRNWRLEQWSPFWVFSSAGMRVYARPGGGKRPRARVQADAHEPELLPGRIARARGHGGEDVAGGGVDGVDDVELEARGSECIQAKAVYGGVTLAAAIRSTRRRPRRPCASDLRDEVLEGCQRGLRAFTD